MDFFSSAQRGQSIAQPSTLISFYDGSGTDSRGRSLSDILQWGVNKLEFSHDYIQTLFPLPERSGINDRAPVIDRQVFQTFRAKADLRDNLRNAFRKMVWFYGFELGTNAEDGKFVVKKAHNYAIHSRNWLRRFDHNHLRITRIIRSLRVLGLQDEALAFYDAVSTATIVSSRSRLYWERAAHRPLNVRPDVEDEDMNEERMGLKFLREFERSKREQFQEGSVAEQGATSAAIVQEEPHIDGGSSGKPKELEKDEVGPGQAITENAATRVTNGDALLDTVN